MGDEEPDIATLIYSKVLERGYDGGPKMEGWSCKFDE
jgi:hypothetical protein